jgi:hypothetical protein
VWSAAFGIFADPGNIADEAKYMHINPAKQVKAHPNPSARTLLSTPRSRL